MTAGARKIKTDLKYFPVVWKAQVDGKDTGIAVHCTKDDAMRHARNVIHRRPLSAVQGIELALSQVVA